MDSSPLLQKLLPVVRLGCCLVLFAGGRQAAAQDPDEPPAEELSEGEQRSEDQGPLEDDVVESYFAWVWQLLGLGFSGTTSVPWGSRPATSPECQDDVYFDHGEWDTLLSRFVDEGGLFDYAVMRQDGSAGELLDSYLGRLAGANLAELPPAEALAFWINAYNACAVASVLEGDLPESVLDVPGFFDNADFRLAGASVTLNDIENDRIRRLFSEPRVHFALNAGTRGGPPLRGEAYRGYSLEQQLEDQARRFLMSTTVVDSIHMEVTLSRLLEWFGRDFEPVGGLREFVARHLEGADAEAVRQGAYMLLYDPFDWSLNRPR